MGKWQIKVQPRNQAAMQQSELHLILCKGEQNPLGTKGENITIASKFDFARSAPSTFLKKLFEYTLEIYVLYSNLSFLPSFS